VLTFLFSFVRIYKVDERGFDAGWSVWTTDFAPGLFGVGTLIPFLALVAGAAALARAFVPGLDRKEVGGFSLLQVQVVAALFAVVLWLGYLISIVFAGSGQLGTDFKLGLGMLLLFLGLAGVVAGTVVSMAEDRKAGAGPSPATGYAPPSGTWAAAVAPPATEQPQWQQPAPEQQQPQWQQPAPEAQQPQWQQPAPAPDQPQWQQPAPAPEQPQWQQPATAPEQQPQWQQPAPDQPQWQQPATEQPQWPAPPPPADQQWQPPTPEAPPSAGESPAPGAPPGGGLFDPGTQVIPGPPPAPPAEGSSDTPEGSGLPPIPPPNTP